MKYLSEMGTWVVAGVGSLYAFVTGHTDLAFQILLAFMSIDIASGLLKGAYQKRLKSEIMSLGIVKKGGIILSIVFAYLLDMLINDGQPVFVTMMTWVAIGNEGLSITENFSSMGIGVPQVVTDRLGQFTDHAKEVQKDKDQLQD